MGKFPAATGGPPVPGDANSTQGRDIFPLSEGQRGLWFLQRYAPESPAYNVAYAGRTSSDLDIEAFRASWQAISDRHPSLRTTFVEMGGEPVQVVHPSVEVPFIHETIDGWTDESVQARIREEIFRPFDLQAGPLMRVLVLSQAEKGHIVVPTFHHIVTDMWSYAIVMRELSEIYGAKKRGVEPCLQSSDKQYADFVERQREMLASEEGERLWQFWSKQLSGELPVLNLPTDRSRPAVQTCHGAAESDLLDAQLSVALSDFARKNKTTSFTVSLAAFQVLLQRYTGQEDILVDSPRACRTADISKVVGYFVNPVALRADLSGDPPFSTLLSQVKQVVTDSFAHGNYPFPLLIQRLCVVKDPSRSALCQVGLAWQKTTRTVSRDISLFALNGAGGYLASEHLTFESLPLKDRVSPFDLTLQMSEVGGALAATIEYNSDLFESTTIRRMLGHFRNLLAGILQDPEKRISALPLLDSEERRKVLTQWSKRPGDAADARIARLFERQVERTPDSVAVVSGIRQWSYQELNTGANRIAHRLMRAGVGPESLVGVCLERCPEMIAALVAVLKTGAGLVPIDPTYPSDRIAFVFQDAGVSAVLTQKSLLPALGACRVTSVCLDTDECVGEEDRNPDVEVHGDSLAYVIYMSGSTGEPKGVGISHACIASHCQTAARHYGTSSNDRVLQFASINFDAGLEQVFVPLIMGAEVVLRDNELWTASEFREKISELKLTVINIPPAYWQECVKEWNRDPSDDMSSVRLVIVGGDVVPPESLNLWRKSSLRSARLLNAYGPTETTITATSCDVAVDVDIHLSTRVPIGRPMPERRAYVLDARMNLVPVGVPGELYLSGNGIARGYLNRAGLTAEMFVPDPYSSEPGARAYRTGDLVRYLSDGQLEFLGRLDEQVKIRGFRIELGEIEAALIAHADVRKAAVVVQELGAGEKRLVAYVAAEKGHPVNVAELTSHLRRRLPEYMLPFEFIPTDSIPMTTGGKVDRRALPAPDLSQRTVVDQYVPPRNPIEGELVKIWAELLGTTPIGVRDNFFRLGGHSLLATQLAARVRDAFQVELPLRSLFTQPTIECLADSIVEQYEQKSKEISLLLGEVERLPEQEVSPLLFERPKAA